MCQRKHFCAALQIALRELARTSTGRKMYPSEGALYRAAAADQDVARSFDEVGSPPQLERQITLLIVALAAPAGCAR